MLANPAKYTHAGLTLTIQQWSNRTGVPPFVIQSRLYQGWPIACALEPLHVRAADQGEGKAPRMPGERKRTMLTLHGETKSIAEWARGAGLSYKLLYQRLARGASLEQALAPRKTRGSSLRQLARRHGVNPRTVIDRMHKGMSLEQALTGPDGRKRNAKTLTCDGITLSVRQWSERTGIPVNTIHGRLRKGMSPKQALTVPRYTHARLLPRSWGSEGTAEAHA
jgi:lambda repressor-like predicted transcriptional regulator